MPTKSRAEKIYERMSEHSSEHQDLENWQIYWREAGPVRFSEECLTAIAESPPYPNWKQFQETKYCEGCKCEHTKFNPDGTPYHVILSDEQKELLVDLWHGLPLALVSAGRGSGKTVILAVYDCWLLCCVPRTQVSALAGSGKQSKLEQKYINQWRIDIPRVKESLPRSLRGIEPRIETNTGGDINFLPCSTTAVRGPHVPIVQIDEACEAEAKSQDGADAVDAIWYQVVGKKNSQIILTSTTHHIFGKFYEYLTNPAKYGFKVYIWSIAKHISGKPPEETFKDRDPTHWIPAVWWVTQSDIEMLRRKSNDSEWLCTPEDTIIFSNTNKEIKDIIPNENVIGEYPNNTVIHKFIRPYSGDLIKIKPRNLLPVYFTPNHTIKIAHIRRKTEWKNRGNYSGTKYIVENPDFIRSDQIKKGDYLIVPRNNNGTVKVNKRFARLLGWYLAEGSISNGKVEFSLGKHEKQFAQELQSIINELFNRKAEPHETRTALKIGFQCNGKTNIFEQFGHKAFNKRIPDFIKEWNEESIKEFISSYVDGDGFKGKDKGLTWTVGTSSKQVMLDLTQLLIKVGIVPYIQFVPAHKNEIEKRTINTKDFWHLSWSYNRWINNPKCPFYIVDKDYIYIPVASITVEKVKDIMVHNIETKENIYCVPFIVHNCEALGRPSLASGQVFSKDDMDLLVCNKCSECYPYRWDNDFKCQLIDIFKLGDRENPTRHIADRRAGFDYGDPAPCALTLAGRKGQFGFILYSDERRNETLDGLEHWVTSTMDNWNTDTFIPDPSIGGKNLSDKIDDKGYAVYTIGEAEKGERVLLVKRIVERHLFIIPQAFWKLITSMRQLAWDKEGKIRKFNDHAVSDDTEILTDNGWKNHQTLTYDDKVATLNKDGYLEYQNPTNIIIMNWDKEMMEFKNKNIDFCFSPNHNYVFKRDVDHYHFKNNKFVLGTYDILPEKLLFFGDAIWKGENIETINIADKIWKIDNYLAFLGIWLSEGWTSRKDRCNQTGIAQNYPKSKLIEDEIMKYIPFKYGKSIDRNCIRFIISNKKLTDYLSQFGKSHDKYIPSWIFNLPSDQLEILYKWMMYGDGTEQKSDKRRKKNGDINIQEVYYTTSKRLADDFQRLLLHLGLRGNIRIENKHGFNNHSIYAITVRRTKITLVNKSKIKSIPYYGKIYCVEVPNHIIYVRRNGKVYWTGNSFDTTQYITVGWDDMTDDFEGVGGGGIFEVILGNQYEKDAGNEEDLFRGVKVW